MSQTSYLVTIWTLDSATADPEYFGKVSIGGASTLESLRFTLESNEILEWQFEFWDVEDKRRVRRKLEQLNSFGKEVHVIQIADGESDGSKRRRLEDGSFTVTAHVEVGVDVPEVPTEDGAVPTVGSSRVSGSGDGGEVDSNPLKSLLLPTDVMDHYLERAKKLRVELQRVAMDDHEWWLKSYDFNGSGIVKLWCAECNKDCGGGNKDHSKAHIDNLFNNFRRSHIVSLGHVRNYCTAKNINFDDHPQSEARNGKPITMTPADHKKLVAEGVQILEGVNATLPEGHKKFTVLGNLEAEDTRCYWFKVKCPYCRDLIGLYPPRKTLEVNLRNHLTGFKHSKAVEDAEQPGAPARTGRPGRPSKSSASSLNSNQSDLHSWFTGIQQTSSTGDEDLRGSPIV